MAEHLIIRLPANAGDPASWVVLDPSGALLAGPQHGELAAAAAELNPARRVSVLLPATEVLRLQAELPVSGRARMLQLLPFALEDQLADDIDELHFAAANRDPRGRLSVAVASRSLLQRRLAELANAGIEARALFAESDGLPLIEGTATLLIDHQAARFMLRQPDGALAAGDLSMLVPLLENGLKVERPAADAEPAAALKPNLAVYQSAVNDADSQINVTALLEPLRPRLNSLDIHELPDGILPRLAAQIASEPGVNLLQGAFARRTGLAAHWPRWQAAAGLAAGLLISMLLVNAVEAFRLQQQAVALEQAVAEAFRQTFPDVTEVRDARAQLDSRLRALGQQGSGQERQFLEALDVLANAIARNSAVRLEGINYRTGSMELRLLAPNVDSLDSVRQQVASGGRFQAEIQSANAQGDQVQGRLRITPGGSS